jgi:hypothetical protein
VGKATGGGFKYSEEMKHTVIISKKITRRLQALKLTHSFSLVFSTHITMFS